MKKLYILIVTSLLLISIMFSGCKETEFVDYVINSTDTITLGVIVSSEEDKGVCSGISYAAELAHSVNIDKTYEIDTLVALSSEDFAQTAAEFYAAKVAAVICEGENKEKTEAIIKAFSPYDTPIVFTDCYSDMIEKSDNVFSVCVPYSYQISAVTSHLISQELTKGAIVCSDDTDYYESFAKMFETTFISSGGNSVTTYYSADEGNFNANMISAASYDFVFLTGNIADNINAYTELKEAGVASSVIFSEVFDRTVLETSDFNSVTFVSKFEADDNNYIGTDFINTFAKHMNISIYDVTASVAYGYDSYMTVYDALVSMHKNSGSIFNTTEASETNENTSIYTKNVSDALKTITHMGVTDVISFNEAGLCNTSFVYLDKIENAHASMLQRYNYAN